MSAHVHDGQSFKVEFEELPDESFLEIDANAQDSTVAMTRPYAVTSGSTGLFAGTSEGALQLFNGDSRVATSENTRRQIYPASSVVEPGDDGFQQLARVRTALNQNLGPDYLSERAGPGGRKVYYLESVKQIDLANELFGFNGWSSSVIEQKFISQDRNDDGSYTICVSATVKIDLRDGSSHQETACGTADRVRSLSQGFDKAVKESVTNARRRALRLFGRALGHCLYEMAYVNAVSKMKKTPAKFDEHSLKMPNDSRSEASNQKSDNGRPLGAANTDTSLTVRSSQRQTYPASSVAHPGDDALQQMLRMRTALNQNLGPDYISERPGPGGRKVPYLEGVKAFDLANEVFGFNGWSSIPQIQRIEYHNVNEDKTHNVGVTTIMRVQLRDGSFREDVGFGSAERAKTKGQAYELACKESATDGRKRALRLFGRVLGNCLYDKKYLEFLTKLKRTPAKFDRDSLKDPEETKYVSAAMNKNGQPPRWTAQSPKTSSGIPCRASHAMDDTMKPSTKRSEAHTQNTALSSISSNAASFSPPGKKLPLDANNGVQTANKAGQDKDAKARAERLLQVAKLKAEREKRKAQAVEVVTTSSASTESEARSVSNKAGIGKDMSTTSAKAEDTEEYDFGLNEYTLSQVDQLANLDSSSRTLGSSVTLSEPVSRVIPTDSRAKGADSSEMYDPRPVQKSDDLDWLDGCFDSLPDLSAKRPKFN